VAVPMRKSLGSRLIETALPRQLGGTARLAFEPTGVAFTLTLPLYRVAPASE
jgi:two-component sensor histidine kinase